MNSLSNRVDYTDTVLLVVPGNKDPSLPKSIQNLLKRITLTFGDGWWDYLVVGVSKWPYDQGSIDGRCESIEYCEDEAYFESEFDKIMRSTFGMDRNLTYVFTDSWSQVADNAGDQLQQGHWQKETDILGNITTTRDKPFPFKTIDQVLEENEQMREKIKWLGDIIAENITQLADKIDQHTQEIKSISTNVASNSEKLLNNTASIEQNMDRIRNNTASIEQNLDKIGNNSAKIEQNKDNIFKHGGEIFNHQQRFNRSAPVGTIIAWYGDNLRKTSIPPGWQLCDGSNIAYGPLLWWVNQLLT